MKLLLLSLILFMVGSCYDKSIEGRWVLEKSKQFSIYHYPEIDFGSEGYVILKSYGDTIYSGRYEIHKNYLLLKIGDEKSTITICKYKADSLVLYGFYNTKDTLIYLREKSIE